MNSAQRSFILWQVFAMSMMATAQRGGLYAKGASEDVRLALRSAIRGRLEGVLPQYRQSVTDAEHVAVIEDLARHISVTNGKALRDGRLRIGSAQKILNLYLKYMWCLGDIAIPPHCPFDSIVLARIPDCQEVRWTQFDSTEEYKRIVFAAKKVAGALPLAEWELRLYNEGVRA